MRTVKAVTALAGWLVGSLCRWIQHESRCSNAHTSRVYAGTGPIALLRIDIFTPTRIIACTTLPSNTVEITDGFSNARAVGFTLLRKTRRSRPSVYLLRKTLSRSALR